MSEVPETAALERRFPRRLLLTGGVAAAVAGAAEAVAPDAAAAPPTQAWLLGGNSNVSSDGSNFLGPRNVAPIIFKTRLRSRSSLTEAMRVTPRGRLGVGTPSPQARIEAHSRALRNTILGANTSTDDRAAGVAGTATAGHGVVGTGIVTNGSTASGVRGTGYSGVDGSGTSYGGFFEASGSNGTGVFAAGVTYGLYASASSGDAVYSLGNATINGNCHVVGTLSKSAGSFKIDHPLDPEHKWLAHSFVESPDMMNVYNGNVILDRHGEATVELPDYFTALNRDFRYQLTTLGAHAPVYISRKVHNNSFAIAGGTAGLEVSWQVTGIRHDVYAKEHPIVVESAKSERDRGTLQFVPRGSSAQPMRRGPDLAAMPPR